MLEARSEQATERPDTRPDLSVSCRTWSGERGSGLVQGSARTVLTVRAAESGGGEMAQARRWCGVVDNVRDCRMMGGGGVGY